MTATALLVSRLADEIDHLRALIIAVAGPEVLEGVPNTSEADTAKMRALADVMAVNPTAAEVAGPCTLEMGAKAAQEVRWRLVRYRASMRAYRLRAAEEALPAVRELFPKAKLWDRGNDVRIYLNSGAGQRYANGGWQGIYVDAEGTHAYRFHTDGASARPAQRALRAALNRAATEGVDVQS